MSFKIFLKVSLWRKGKNMKRYAGRKRGSDWRRKKCENWVKELKICSFESELVQSSMDRGEWMEDFENH